MERFNTAAFLVVSIVLSFPRQGNFAARIAEMLQAAPKPDTHVWYVRTDGGDRKQCTGHTDAAYSGRGNMQPCALKHPYYLFTNGDYGDKKWIVAGGDTMILRGGPYRIGFRGPQKGGLLGLLCRRCLWMRNTTYSVGDAGASYPAARGRIMASAPRRPSCLADMKYT